MQLSSYVCKVLTLNPGYLEAAYRGILFSYASDPRPPGLACRKVTALTLSGMEEDLATFTSITATQHKHKPTDILYSLKGKLYRENDCSHHRFTVVSSSKFANWTSQAGNGVDVGRGGDCGDFRAPHYEKNYSMIEQQWQHHPQL